MKVFNMNNMDDEQKGEFQRYLETLLVGQAVEQHRAACPGWDEGIVLSYWFEDDEYGDRELRIRYNSGNVWRYACIDLGAEGMVYEMVTEDTTSKEKEDANDVIVEKVAEKEAALRKLVDAYSEALSLGITIVNINSTVMKFIDDKSDQELGELGYSKEIMLLTGQKIVECELNSNIFGEGELEQKNM